MAADLPQYSWGLDPTTGQWSYFMNKAGSQSADIGRKAGDKLGSYQAPAGDAASIQQQALNHLLNTQLDANAPAATTPATAAPTNVVGSGIAQAAAGQGGHGAAGEPSAWSQLSDADQASYYADHPTMAAITQAGQGLFGMTNLGMLQKQLVPDFVDRQAYIAAGRDPSNPQAQGTSTGGYGPMGGGGYGIDVGGDAPTAGESQAQAQAAQVNAQAQAAVEAAQQADSSRAAAAAAAEGAAGDSHESQSSSPSSDSDNGNGGHYSADRSGGDSSSSSDAIGGWRHNGTMHAPAYADGGPVAGLHAAASLPPRFVRGPGDGQSDNIPVNMSDGGIGHLADNEFVIPADAVSALGSGSSEAGARALYEMVDRIRHTAHGSTQQAKPVTPGKVMPV